MVNLPPDVVTIYRAQRELQAGRSRLERLAAEASLPTYPQGTRNLYSLGDLRAALERDDARKAATRAEAEKSRSADERYREARADLAETRAALAKAEAERDALDVVPRQQALDTIARLCRQLSQVLCGQTPHAIADALTPSGYDRGRVADAAESAIRAAINHAQQTIDLTQEVLPLPDPEKYRNPHWREDLKTCVYPGEPGYDPALDPDASATEAA